MATSKELEAVASVLDDALAAGEVIDADELSARVWDVVEGCRRRRFKYVTICQDREVIDRETVTLEEPAGATLTRVRAFHPTWVQGPYYTALEATTAARAIRLERPEVKVMTAQVFESDQEIKLEPHGVWM